MFIPFIGITAQTRTATLKHQGATQVFKGRDAFSLAYDVAVDGDEIVLSNGEFWGVDINKSITITGADTELLNQTTTIFDMGGLGYKAPVTVSLNNLVIDNTLDIDYDCVVTAELCKFNGSVSVVGRNPRDNPDKINPPTMTFKKCIFEHKLFISAGTATLTNCGIKTAQTDIHANVVFDHCTFIHQDMSLRENTTLKNCLLVFYNDYYTYGPTEYCYYNGPQIVDWSEKANVSNCVKYFNGSGYEAEREIFNPQSNPYDLKAQYAEKWLGNDGTQVGMYGGTDPYPY